MKEARLSSALALVAAIGCTRASERDAGPALGWLILDPDADLAAAPPPAIRSSPAGLVREAVRSGGAIMVGVDLLALARAARGSSRLEIDGACPVSLDLGEIAAAGDGGSAPPHRPLHSRVVVTEPAGAAQLGFGARFTLQITAGCSDPAPAAGVSSTPPSVVWRQIGGPALPELVPSDGGRRVDGRMPTFAAGFAGPVPWGVVPLSPRTRGQVVLEAQWTESDGRAVRHQVHLAAAARARGLANTPVGARIFLGGQGWRLVERPDGSGAALDGDGDGHSDKTLTSLVPDVAGTWQLADGGGRRLQLLSARYDQTLLDCGRSGCHASIAEAAARNPMTSVLARDLDGRLDAADSARYPACAIACHAVGEPGVADGGFTDLAAELGWNWAGRWQDLPRALRRAGGVGCLACHGPSAIPEAGARDAILRADVCAVCHDAPPRYGHVVAWNRTAMARAGREPRARTEKTCARCHTTAGFLTSIAARSGAPAPGRAGAASAPVHGDASAHGDDGAPAGIACAACHAVHDHQLAAASGAAPTALLRAPPTPDLLIGASADGLAGSAICLGCHTPALDAASPVASAAALWLGRGGLDPRSGRPLRVAGDAPHARVAGGCVGCHRGGPSELARGAAHSFEASPATCLPCHAKPPAPAPFLGERARRLWGAWLARSGARAPTAGGLEGATIVHAAPRPPRIDRSTPLGRAGWDLLLVLEDPAAAQHNAPYARALLAAAEEVLGVAPAQLPPASPTTRTSAQRGDRR